MTALFALLFGADPETAVRATLDDGQVLMGEVHTRTLRLESGVGPLDIPLADVGEVVPVSEGGLGVSEGLVNVWLKNGSELRGRWADPKLAMGILVGGKEVAVDLPMNELSRFQLQGDARWPGGPVYRMRTAHGDDFLVDPARTHLVLENDFGTFEPLLSECRSVAPVDDAEGAWRVELQTGTVLLGHLRDATLTVALPMGPEEVSVPLDQFVSLRIESWGAPPVAAAPSSYAPSYTPSYAPPEELGRVEPSSAAEGAPSAAMEMPYPAKTSAAPRPERADDGWFESDALEATKRAYDEE